MEILNQVLQVSGALSAIVGGLITISLLIPGEQPEKTLQKMLDFLKKISLK